MTRLIQYKKKHAELQDAMRAMLDRANAADRDFTEEEGRRYRELDAQLADAAAKIKREEAQAHYERTAPAVTVDDGPVPGISHVYDRADGDPKRGFASPAEYLTAVVAASGPAGTPDPRLRPLAQRTEGGTSFVLPWAFSPGAHGLGPRPRAAAGSDEHSTFDFGHGGAAVPSSMHPELLSVAAEPDPTTGRTFAIEMPTPTVKILARTDKNHTTSVAGGLTVSRKPEGVAGDSSRGEMERIVLDAHMLVGVAFESWELMQDAPRVFAQIIDRGMREQFGHAKLSEKLRGNGGNEYLGIINALDSAGDGPTISVTRQASGKIRGADVVNTRKRLWSVQQPIWLANHDTRGELTRIGLEAFDTGATPLSGLATLYRSSMAPGMPDMLDGLPIFYSEYPSKLGDPGDLILADWSQYLEGTRLPLQSRESMHVRFLEREQTFQFFERNAGAPWWRSALTPHQSSETLSPFVILGAA